MTDMALVDILECFDDILAEQLLAVMDCISANGFSSFSGVVLIPTISVMDMGASPPPSVISPSLFINEPPPASERSFGESGLPVFTLAFFMLV
jgi:hypothetical protein